MKQITISIFICLLLSLLTSCSESSSKDFVAQNCEKQAQIIEQETYNLVNTTNYMITGVALNENCLDVTISSSGCSGSTWEMNLLSSPNFTETPVLQRNTKIELSNNEACAAIFQKTVSFDLIPLQINGQDQIIVNIEGWDDPIIYNY
jgi:hypothetical protein